MMQAGTNAIIAYGFKAALYFIADNYATLYPGQTWGSTPTNLVELVQTPGYQHILDSSLERVYFKTWTFANGTDGNVFQFVQPFQLDAEYNELKAFCVHLLQNTSGKDFFIQTTESDFDYLGGVDLTKQPVADRAQRLIAFFGARIRAVQDARAEAGPSTSRVFSAIECNRVLDAGRRVYNDILPYLDPDFISLSIYEAIEGWATGLNEAQSIASIDTLVRRVITRVRTEMAKTHGKRKADAWPIYFGEWAWPEARSEFGAVPLDVKKFVVRILTTAQEMGVVSANFWQLWDNVIGPTDGLPVGVYGDHCIQRLDNSITNQGAKLLELLA